jgi:hypothetical protein
MGRPTNEERARRAAAAVAEPPIETKVEPASAPIEVRPDNCALAADQAPRFALASEPLVLAVPTESYSAASAVFRRQLDGWIDEVQRQGMHRGEQLVLVAPKE